jgi:hypothetical protein
MSILAGVNQAVERHNADTEEKVRRARKDTAFGDELLRRWAEAVVKK